MRGAVLPPPGAPPLPRRPARSGGGQARGGGGPRGWFVAEHRDPRARGIWLLLAFAAMAVTIGAHLVDLQVRQHGWLSAEAVKEHRVGVVLPGRRGLILDRSGRVLASDKAVYTVFVDPSLVDSSKRRSVAQQLAPVVHRSVDDLMAALARPTHYVELEHQASEQTKQKLEKMGIDGIGTIPEQQRVYEPSPVPGESFASNLIGYVDADGKGQYGVEGYYNALLNGSDGFESTLTDVDGNAIVLGNQQRRDPQDGQDLQLGLDSEIQYWAEQAIANGVQNAEAESGQLLIMDTHTGAIRAWAQYPSFDANAYWKGDVSTFRDQSVAGLFEPGSTMKVVTFAGGLQNGAITPGYTFNEQQSVVDGYLIHDWDDRSHGVVTMQKVLDDSLNNGAMKVEQLEGQDAFYRNLLAFGIGAPTGVDLWGEVNQPIPDQSKWHPIDYAEASFGQYVEATPVEMLAAINAVADGGVWVQPHAVDAVVDPATGAAKPFTPNTRRVISTQTASTLATMMTGVVDDAGGSGYAARIAEFKGQVAGKTGTAQEPTNGSYQGDVVDSFVGFLPASNPQFTMLVVLRSPHTHKVAHEGAYLAAPVWKQMALVLIDQWRIRP